MSGREPRASDRATDVVIDASVGIKWFIPEVHSEDARRFLTDRFHRHAPALFLTEVGQTLWKKVHQRDELSADEGRDILRALETTSLQIHPLTALLEPAFDIALATGRTFYDSVYLALSIALGCKLVTADRRLFNSLQGSPFGGDVLWVEDSA
jgi:predicted nucleic acid-binding protein